MIDTEKYRLQRGESSLLISVPHSGTAVPTEIEQQFSKAARNLPDTDWYVDRLYGWAPETGAGMLVAPWSRYVVDLNRPPDDKPLYDQSTSALLTGLIPHKTFSGDDIYTHAKPAENESSARLAAYWAPYHDCLAEELERIRQRHGFAVLLDAHSIRSQQPLLFDGTLPDLNLGSNSARSADSTLIESARKALSRSPFTLVVDGRFKGGYITRHYGRPADGIHALQLEMAQSAYMREDPPEWDEEKAAAMTGVLKNLVAGLSDWKP